VVEVVRTNEKEHDETAELQEVQKGDISIKMDFREPRDCKNIQELYDLAKNRGYKKGWAYHQAKMMGFM